MAILMVRTDYSRELKAYKNNYSEVSLLTYSKTMALFEKVMGKPVNAATKGDLLNFLDPAVRPGLSNNTRRQHYKALFSYFAGREVIDGIPNPLKDISKQMAGVTAPAANAVTSGTPKLEKLLEFYRPESLADPLQARDYIAVGLLYYTGIIPRELMRITKEDLDFSEKNPQVTILASSGNKRPIPLNKKFVHEARQYLDVWERNREAESDYIFTRSNKSDKLNVIWLQRLLQQFPTTTVEIRRDFGWRARNAGMPLEELARIMNLKPKHAINMYGHIKPDRSHISRQVIDSL